jgi:Uma2 family endonuclease
MALVPTLQPYRFTVEKYLAFERASDERHEYLEGVIYAMAGEIPDHGRICMNLAATFVPQLGGSDCKAFSKDLKVRCGPYWAHSREGLYAYPDLVVVCGALQFHDQVQDVLVNPVVIVEVLSPSTEAFDRGEKFHRYRTWLPTLTDYLLVAQHRPLIDHYHRQEESTWVLRTLEGLHAHVHLGTMSCTVPLANVYERIAFPQAEEEEARAREELGRNIDT